MDQTVLGICIFMDLQEIIQKHPPFTPTILFPDCRKEN
jgi:hypothetical protein